jgi:MFS family permease
MPTTEYLMAARRTTIVIGALTCLTVFLIVTLLSNWLGGTLAGVFMGVHPLSVYLSTIAVSDAAFTFVVALSVLAAIWLARKPTWGRTLLLGVIFGIGTSLKLSPMFVTAGLAIVGGLILAGPLAARVRPLRWFWARMGADEPNVARLGWMLIALPLIAATFFVASYPYLWPDPIGRTEVLLDFRRDEMRAQSRIWGDAAIGSRSEALSRTWTMLEERYSASGKVLVKLGITEPRPGHRNGAEPGYDLPFALAGTAIFVALALWRGFRSPMFLAFLVLAGQALVIIVGLNVDFDRYYLPLVMTLAVGLGVGAGEIADLVLGRLNRRTRVQRQEQDRPIESGWVSAG